MKKQLLEQPELKIEKTLRGTWRRCDYSDGSRFAEYVSHSEVMGLPLIHYTRGRCPDTGKIIVARGFIAVGQFAVGVIALGQAALGAVAFGQLALGFIFGLGQAATGAVAIGQLAIGLAFAFGQFAIGYVAIGQFGLGRYVMGQIGLGQHVWDARGSSEAAKAFFGRFPH